VKRRDFIVGLGSSLAIIPFSNLNAVIDELNGETEFKLNILHTNDTHSRIDPFPNDGSQWSGKGGVSRRAAYFATVKSNNTHTLIVDAGDILQGTPYFNYYKGEVEIEAMNKMGYEVATLGNHDFDAGIERLATLIEKAHFSFINCNYDVAGTPIENKFTPFKIIKKGKLKIGLYGLGVDLDGLHIPEIAEKIKYTDPIIAAQKAEKQLKEQNCNLIICLSHLGNTSRIYGQAADSDIAKNTRCTDLIIGGHTHTFLEKPQNFTNLSGKTVLVNQVGWAGIWVGNIEFYFDSKGKKTIVTNTKMMN
jgi:5'-nucleotidase